MNLNYVSLATQLLVQRSHEQIISSSSNGIYSSTPKHGFPTIIIDLIGPSAWCKMTSAITSSEVPGL